MKNKIGWCNLTFNPVWGCRNNCEYCYARGIAKRFWKKMYEREFNFYYMAHPNWVWTGDYLSGLKNFKPTFLEAQYVKKFPKKSQRIFVGSMSEIYYWEQEWIERVIEKVKQYPQHTFMFLTQHPEVYCSWPFPENCWLGVTVTKNREITMPNVLSCIPRIKYISIEPLLEEITFLDGLMNYDWVIIGAETGNRKGKVIPKLDWINNIIYYCKKNDIPIYLKDSLKLICPSLWKVIPIMKNQPSFLSYRPIKEFPKEVGL